MSYNVNLVPNIAPHGTVMQYTGATDPSGWVICDGVTRSNTSGTYNRLINSGFFNQNSYSYSATTTFDTIYGGNTLAISGDGNTLMIGSYLTTNNCISFTPCFTPYAPMASNNAPIAISYNGQFIVMGSGYYSTNQGTSWQNNGYNSTFCAIGNNYQYVLLDALTSTALMLSTNGGISYNQINGNSSGIYSSNGLPTTTTNYTIAGITMSLTGTVMAAVFYNTVTYYLYLSTNAGSTWSIVNQSTGNMGAFLKISGNGTSFVTCSANNSATGLFYSTNQGSTFISALVTTPKTTAISDDGTKMAFFYGTFVYTAYLSTNSGASFYNTAGVAAGGEVNLYFAVSGNFSKVYFARSYNSQGTVLTTDYFATYNLPNNYNKNYLTASNNLYKFGLSSNGSVMLAPIGTVYNGAAPAITNGLLYLSTNQGATWKSVQVGQSWRAASVSGNGLVLIAGVATGRVYLSTNMGTTWYITSLPNASWYCSAISTTGQYILMGISNSSLYLSTSTGTYWSSVSGPGNNWGSCAMSTNGSIMIAGNWGGNGSVWVSINTGSTWTQINSIPAGAGTYYWGVALSATGSTMLACLGGTGTKSNIYLCTDGTGATWTQLSGPAGISGNGLPATVQQWGSVSCSGDGTRMLATICTYLTGASASVYFSSTSGNTWNTLNNVSNPFNGLWQTNTNWWCSAISTDGSTYMAGSPGANNIICISTDGNAKFWYALQNGTTTNNAPQVVPVIINSGSVKSISSNSTSSIVIFASTANYLYISYDSGASYNQMWCHGNLQGTKNWTGSAASSTGQFMLVCASGENIYYSSTYGYYWIQISGGSLYQTNGLPTTTSSWSTCAIDTTGAFMLAGINSGSLYLSTNSASYWTMISGAANSYGLPTTASAWSACTISGNSTYMLACINSGSLFMSTNTGNNWTMIGGSGAVSTFGLPTVSTAWTTVSINSTGNYMLAGTNPGSLYYSTNYGSYWKAIGGITNSFGLPNSAVAWSCTTINSSGTVMSAAINGGQLYSSINNGKSWSTNSIGISSILNWSCMTMNSEGTYMVAAQTSGNVFNINLGVIPTATYTPLQITNATSTDGTTLKYIMKY